jgi:RNA polymerase II subunit A small phosphatase-like protein
MLPSSDKLLILDLDETLVHSVEKPLERPSDFRAYEYEVYKRPGVEEFLSVCAAMFEMAVWTSSGSKYAHEVIEHIFPKSVQLKFIFTGERCTRCWDYEVGSPYYIKNLKKVKRKGYSLEKVLIIDDTPEKLSRNYGNLIRVQEYHGTVDDEELSLLLKYLELIKTVPNVRSIEKRGWRHKVKSFNDNMYI